MAEMKLISQRAYPNRAHLKEYIRSVENIENPHLRRTLKLLMCTGLRIGELLNSYIYYDNQTGEMVIRALAEKVYRKKRIALHRMPARGFLGEKYLQPLLGADVWRSKTVRNLFGLHLAEVLDMVSDDARHPSWLGPALGRTYRRLYRLIKSSFQVEIAYRASKRERPFSAEFSPSFHFFRKLYSAELAFQQTEKVNPALAMAKVVDDMQWENADMLLVYVKDYAPQ